MEKIELVGRANRLRLELAEDTISPIDIFALALTIEEISLFLYPLGHGLSGMCVKSHDATVIAINSMMSKGRQRFTLAHELYHYRYGEPEATTICPYNTSSENSSSIEQEADRFASFLLLPVGAFEEKMEKAKRSSEGITQEDVIKLEQQYGISHQAMLKRLTSDGIITPAENLKLKDGVISAARRLGFDISLYRTYSEEDAPKMVLGKYVKMADSLLERSIISAGKYDEILLAGYRSDIVYGDEEDEQADD